MSTVNPTILAVVTKPAASQQHLLSQVNELVASTGHAVRLLCVLPPELESFGHRGVINPVEDIVGLTRQRLSDALADYPAIREAEVKVCFGKPFMAIIRHVVQGNVSLVVKAAGETHWTDKVLGSDDMHLLRKCPAPVLLLRAARERLARNVMIAVDFDRDDPGGEEEALNQHMLSMAGQLFRHPDTRYSLVNVFAPPLAGFASLFASDPEGVSVDLLDTERQFKLSELGMLQHYAEQSLAKYFSGERAIRTKLFEGQAAQTLPEVVQSNQVELLVMGTLARAGIPGLLIGNTAEDVIGHVGCDVLALKPGHFRTPLIF